MGARINCSAMSFCQVVEDSNVMTVIQEDFGADAPDVTSAAND